MANVQFEEGTFSPADSNVIISLPNPTDAGNRVVIGITGNSLVTQPGGSPFASRSPQENQMGQYVFDKQGAADNSWTFTQTGGGGHWWVAEVLDGVFLTSAGTNGASGAQPSASVNPTAGDIVIFASLGCISGSAGAVRTITAVTSSFILQSGQGGDGTGDSPMGAVATREFTNPGSTNYNTTATFSGSTFGQTSILAAYTTTADPGAATATPAVIATAVAVPNRPLRHPAPTVTSQNSGADTTSYNVNIPACQPGDLLIISAVKDGTGVITFPGSPAWSTPVGANQQASDSHFHAVRHRWVDGTEGWGSGATIALTGASEGWAVAVTRITGAHATTPPEAAVAFNSTGTVNPNPPSLDPAAWADEDTLWFVTYGWDGNVSHTSYPANYTTAQTTSRWANTAGSGVAMAARLLTSASEDPGTATISGAEEWTAFTIAVRPAGAGSNATVTPAVIATVATLPASNRNVSAGPAVVVALVDMPDWAIDISAAPDPVTATVAVPQATPLAGGNATVAPATIAAAVALVRPAVSVRAAPGVVASVVTLPARAVNVQARPAVTPTAAALPSATASGGAAGTATPATIGALVALPAATVTASQNATVSPATITAAVTLPAATRSGTATVQPATVATSIAVPTPTIQSSGNTTVTPTTITAATAVPRAAVGTSVTLASTAVTTALPGPTVGSATIVQPATVAATVTLPASSTAAATTVTPVTITVAAGLPAVAVLGRVAPAPEGRLTVATLTPRRTAESLAVSRSLTTLEEG